MVKDLPANAGDTGDQGSIPGSGRSPGGGKGDPLQYSCLENPVDRGAWWTTFWVRAGHTFWVRKARERHHHTRIALRWPFPHSARPPPRLPPASQRGIAQTVLYQASGRAGPREMGPGPTLADGTPQGSSSLLSGSGTRATGPDMQEGSGNR